MEEAVVAAHNARRVRHGAVALSYCSRCAAHAKAQARECARLGRMQHGGHREHGEGQNIYACGGSGAAPPAADLCKAAVESWYSEIRDYRPGAGFQKGTGHFTQLVWKASTRVGVGIAEGKRPGGGYKVFLVCNYSCAGNTSGQFDANVQVRAMSPRRSFAASLPPLAPPDAVAPPAPRGPGAATKGARPAPPRLDAPPGSPPASRPPAVGARVVAHGLRQRAELNGEAGEVVGHQRAPDGGVAVQVRFDSGTATALRPANLRPLPSRLPGSPASSDPPAIGARVVAHGLRQRAELNGESGEVVGHQRAPDGGTAVQVRFDSGTSTALRPANLHSLRPPPPNKRASPLPAGRRGKRRCSTSSESSSSSSSGSGSSGSDTETDSHRGHATPAPRSPAPAPRWPAGAGCDAATAPAPYTQPCGAWWEGSPRRWAPPNNSPAAVAPPYHSDPYTGVWSQPTATASAWPAYAPPSPEVWLQSSGTAATASAWPAYTPPSPPCADARALSSVLQMSQGANFVGGAYGVGNVIEAGAM